MGALKDICNTGIKVRSSMIVAASHFLAFISGYWGE